MASETRQGHEMIICRIRQGHEIMPSETRQGREIIASETRGADVADVVGLQNNTGTLRWQNNTGTASKQLFWILKSDYIFGRRF